jgi:prepilin-type N-terminal cleavage/methylation domain-containing protein
MKKQSGFTLIEIAIVLVIIGLLLGGVLKGQELINSAKVKNLATDFKNIPVYIYGYQDKFRALPGDDINAANHLQGGIVATTGGTAGNGQIDGIWNSSTITDETYLFWQHVRLANLAPGNTDVTSAAYAPTNAVGGRLGITNSPQSPIIGLSGSFIICSDAIAGRFAKQLDIQMDDGNTAGGSIRVAPVGTTTPVVALASNQVDDNLTYLVCMSN